MLLSDFKIGQDFYLGTNGFRCTDIGSRVVVGIALRARVGTAKLEELPAGGQVRLLSETETEAGGWLKGPPYDSGEIVFDETEIAQCTPTPDEAAA